MIKELNHGLQSEPKILLMNVFAPTIDHYVIETNIKRRKKRGIKTAVNLIVQKNNNKNNLIVIITKTINFQMEGGLHPPKYFSCYTTLYSLGFLFRL